MTDWIGVDMKNRTLTPSLCAITDDEGECFRPVVPGCPLFICAGHLIQAHSFAQELLDQRQPRGRRGKPHFRNFEPSVVYYIRLDGKIKIGTSTRLPDRMRAIRHQELLAVEPGSLEVESRRHRQFDEFHVEGEWFDASMPLLQHVVETRETYGDPLEAWDAIVAARTTHAKPPQDARAFR